MTAYDLSVRAAFLAFSANPLDRGAKIHALNVDIGDYGAVSIGRRRFSCTQHHIASQFSTSARLKKFKNLVRLSLVEFDLSGQFPEGIFSLTQFLMPWINYTIINGDASKEYE